MAHLIRPRWIRWIFRSDDGGFSLVEICVAMTVMSVALLGVVGSMGSGLSLVGQSRQRSSAAEVAQQAVEAIHDIAYSQVALSAAPIHSTDASNPDFNISGSNFDPDGTGSGAPEPLDVDTTTPGLVAHSNTVTVGTTSFTVYRYVTWVDDATIPSTACPSGGGTTCDYKRVVVTVVWTTPMHRGTLSQVTQSTFITDGLVNVSPTTVLAQPPGTVVDHLAVSTPPSALAGQVSQFTVTAQDNLNVTVPTFTDTVHFTTTDTHATVPANYTFTAADAGSHQFSITFGTTGSWAINATDTTSATVASATSTPISVTPPPCPGDSTAPIATTLSIQAPAYTKATGISLQLQTTDTGYNGGACNPISADLSNDGKKWTTVSTPLISGQSMSAPWSVVAPDGVKTVYARFRDGNGNTSQTVSAPVILDTTAPTTPGQPFKVSCTKGKTLSLTLSWTASTDLYLAKYELWRADLNTAIAPLAPTTAQAIDTTVSNNNTYTYTVKAFDAAGNSSSSPPLAITFSTSALGCS